MGLFGRVYGRFSRVFQVFSVHSARCGGRLFGLICVLRGGLVSLLSVAESPVRARSGKQIPVSGQGHELPGLLGMLGGGRLTGLLFLSVNDSLRTGYCVYPGGWCGVWIWCLDA